MARSRGSERPRPGRAFLYEAPNCGPHRDHISGDTRADWSEAFEFVPGLQVAYVWHASKFTSECSLGCSHRLRPPPADYLGQATHRPHGTLYWFQHEPCWYVRKKNAPWFGKAGENSTIWYSPSPKFIFDGSEEEKFDHPTQKPIEVMRRPILNHTLPGEAVYDCFLGAEPR